MVALNDSRDARKQGREITASPYARKAKLNESASGETFQRGQRGYGSVSGASQVSRGNKQNSGWGISSLWKWISSWPEEEERDNQDGENANGMDEVDNEPKPEYVATPAALRLRQRGHEISEAQILPGGLPLSPAPVAADMRQLAPRQARTPDDVQSIDSTRDWLQNKITRGEPIQADEALNILGLLNDIQSAPKQSSLQYQLHNPRFTLAGSRASSAAPSVVNTPTKTLKSNPNGDIFSRGIGSSGRRSPALGTTSRDTFASSTASKSGEWKKKSLWESTSSTSSAGWKQSTSSNKSPPHSTGSPIAKASGSNSLNSSTSTDPGSTRGFGGSPRKSMNPPQRSRYAATVEDAAEDDDNAPPTISLSSTMPPPPTTAASAFSSSQRKSYNAPPKGKYAATVEDASDDEGNAPPQTSLSSTIPSTSQAKTQTQAHSSQQSSIFTTQTASKESGSPNTQLRSKYGPRRPSPLRQSTRPESPTSSPPNLTRSTGNTSPTASTSVAYNIMNDIIKEAVAETPKPPSAPAFNVTNPYQRDNFVRKAPIKRVPAPKWAPKAKVEPPKPAVQQKPKTTGNSFLDFLGNSGPPNGKRARVEESVEEDSEMSQPSAQKAKISFTVEEPSPQKSAFRPNSPLAGDDLEVEDLSDKPGSSNGAPVSKPSEVVEPPAAQSKPTAKPGISTSTSTSSLNKPPAFYPKEPSPLRQSFQAAEDDSPETNDSNVDTNGAPEPQTEPLQKRLTRDDISKMPVEDLPKFDAELYFDHSNPPKYSALAVQIALAVPEDELPVFDLSPNGPDTPIRVHGKVTTTYPSSEPVEDIPTEQTETKTDLPPYKSTDGFNWAAAGLKPPTADPTKWTCDTCMVSNNPETASQCRSCEAPKPPSKAAPSEPPKTEFNWAAAGIKPPVVDSTKWTCDTCMISSNPVTATQCQSCEAPRPTSTSTTVEPPKTGFNWAAAGLKQPTLAAGEWKCGLCNTTNTPKDTKCSACDEPAPSSTSNTEATSKQEAPAMPKPPSFPTFSMPKPPSGGFSWGASK